MTDFAFYIQNDQADDVTVIAAGGSIIPYDPDSSPRQMAGNSISGFQVGQFVPGTGSPNAGDIQVAGPGTVEVLAGSDLTLGIGPNDSDGTGVGITTIGNAANPYLPFNGAQVIAAAGLGTVADGLNHEKSFKWQTFETDYPRWTQWRDIFLRPRADRAGP